MAYVQRATPPPNKVMNFTLDVFSGGLNNRSNILQNHESSYLMNMSFSTDEVMEKRKGSERYDSFDFHEPILFIDEYKPYDSENALLRATATKLYAGESVIHELSGHISGVNYNGRYYFSDGSGLYVYGTFHQSEGTYTKIIGTPSPDLRVMKVVSPPEDYTPLDTTHTEGVHGADYNINTIWYEPCQFELEDTYKGANIAPERVKYVVSHHGRLFVSGDHKDDDNVFISDIQNPSYFPVYLPIQLPPNSDQIVGMTVYDNCVLVSRNNDIYAIEGMTNRLDAGSALFTLRKLNTHTGFANHRSVDVSHNYLLFLGNDGNAYALSSAQQNERILATQIISNQIDVFTEPLNISKSDLQEAVSCFFDDVWYVSMKDKVLLYSYRHRAWSLYQGLNIRSFYSLNGELIWGDEAGHTTHFSDDFYDKGVPFLAEWHSKNFDMDDPVSFKHFREFFMVAEVFDELSSDIRVLFQVDYTDVRNEVIVSNQISRWGISKFGDRFITRNINASFPFVIGRRGRYIKVILKNGYDSNTTVYATTDLPNVENTKDGETLVYVTMEGTYYLYKDREWHVMEDIDLNQPMKVYQINGEYELRGKR